MGRQLRGFQIHILHPTLVLRAITCHNHLELQPWQQKSPTPSPGVISFNAASTSGQRSQAGMLSGTAVLVKVKSCGPGACTALKKSHCRWSNQRVTRRSGSDGRLFAISKPEMCSGCHRRILFQCFYEECSVRQGE